MLVYALITVNQGSFNNVIDSVKKIGSVIREIFYLYGEYDLLLRLNVVSDIQLNDIIKKLKHIEDVTSVKHLIATDITREADVLGKKL